MAGRVHLCRVAGNTVIPYGKWRPVALRWVSHEALYTALTCFYCQLSRYLRLTHFFVPGLLVPEILWLFWYLTRLTLQTWTLHYSVTRFVFITPPPVGGRGIVFGRFVSFFVSLFLCQQHYEKTAWLICMKFSGKVWSDHGTTWLNFGSIRVNGLAGQRLICLLSPAIAQTLRGVLTSTIIR